MEILPFVATWVNLEGTVLSKVRQAQKEKLHGLADKWNLKKSQIHRSRELNRGRQGGGRGANGEMSVKGSKCAVI